MPYIKKDLRDNIKCRQNVRARSPGELNFQLTEVIKDYMELHGLCYGTINDILGALEGCKLEYYERVARPYEDKKIKENGDVY